MENCICFCSHILNENLIKYIEYLKEESKELFDFWVIYDNHGDDIDISNYDFNIFQFNSLSIENFFTLGFNVIGGACLPNPILGICEFRKKYKYSHYLMMENDIILNGNIRDFFIKLFNNKETDFIHIATDTEIEKYNPIGDLNKKNISTYYCWQRHWPVMYIKDNPFNDIHFCWQHMEYLSDNLLSDYENMYNLYPFIYYEFLIPSIAYNNNYTIKQFENFGYKFEVGWKAKKYMTLYTLNKQENTFYHPIKDIEVYLNDVLK